jgi:PAS domain S-box-containing protein
MNAPRDTPLRVLLLEDSRFDAELLRESLRASYPAATLEVVDDEPSFVAAIAEGGFDLVLSDYELPAYSGAQALEHVLATCPSVPFIFVSGVIGEDNAVEMLKRGATDYVSKGRTARLGVVIDRALREVSERDARDRAERQLREADAMHARVVDALRDYAVLLLDADGRIRRINRAARDVFGHPPEAVLGQSAAMLFTEEDRAEGVFEAELAQAARTGRANDDRWMLRADGARIWCEGEVALLADETGTPRGFAKILRDATERHAAAAALRAAKEDAERANRAKDRFLAVLSHELRTPLAPIAAAAHALELAATVPEKYKGLLPMIQRNVALEARLIEDLLDLTAIAAGKVTLRRARVDMHHLVRVVLEMVDEQVREKSIAITVDLAAGDAWVDADAARMQQVLWNVVRNAIKFTPAGGSVVIRTASDDRRFMLSCTDTGIGIDRDALPRIFTAFEQADREVSQRYGGLGLGLAIARGLVLEHGGALAARSDGRGTGATFELTLALAAATSTPAVAETPADARAAVRDRNAAAAIRILLVEDNADAGASMALSLEALGYRVVHVTTGRDARAVAKAGAFDVVVTDLGLPDGNGFDLGRELAGRFPVIALSGYGMARDLERSSRNGFSGHLTKPADPAAVHALVQSVLAARVTRAAERR